ncbi:MAG: hypothetical protein JWM44_1928 [Bacilli bacterium]|nr:hypothetical protein [Bacilli bacterium]
MGAAPKKVCFLTSVHPLFDTRIFYKEACSLVAAGYDVTLIVPNDDLRETVLEGVKIIPLHKPVNRKERMMKTMWELWRKALEQKADLYHFHDPELMFIGLLLRIRGYKVIYDVHEDVPKQIKQKEWVPLRHWVSFAYRVLEWSICRYFILVIAGAAYENQYPRGTKKALVQNFPLLRIFPKADEELNRTQTIVYLGGVTQMRGIDVVLEALHLIRLQGRQVQFDCIGPITDAYRSHLEQLCMKWKLKEQVTFYGRMKASDAYKIVSKAAVGVAILQPVSNYTESFPTKMFEYMALQIPVIVSNFPLYEKTVNEANCGTVIDPQDAHSLAAQIIHYLDQPENARQLGINGRKAVETRFNWSVEESKLLKLYQDVFAN